MAFRFSFAALSLAILVLCLINYVVEYQPTWRDYQKQYYARLAEKVGDPKQAEQVRRTRPSFEQIYNPELNVVDRCIICHRGIDNRLMAGAPNPFKMHPGDLLQTHPYQKVGCTICHSGDGRATTWDPESGHVVEEGKPLLTGHFVQAACAKCHREDQVPEAPVLSRGKQLIAELGCAGCHRMAQFQAHEKVGPRLDSLGSKVSKSWLVKWLLNPTDYLPNAKMPHYQQLTPPAANALADYLLGFRDKAIDSLKVSEGDYDAGDNVRRQSQCVVCHWTGERAGKPVGGSVGPSLLRIGNKTNKRWLFAFLSNPHAFYPNTKMPRFHFTPKQVTDLVQFALEEWVDYDLLDQEEQEPKPPAPTPASVRVGKLLFNELGCSGCHDLGQTQQQPIGPELTYMGSKHIHELDFGQAHVRHTLPDFIYTKLVAPRSLHKPFRLTGDSDAAAAIWASMQPAAIFSKARALPPGPLSQTLNWILDQAKAAQLVDKGLVMPQGSARDQARWLVNTLNAAGALNPLIMPKFKLSPQDAEAITIALLSMTEERIPSEKYVVPRPRKPIFNPSDRFGELVHRYRCLSCHSIRGDGDPLACDISYEGTKVNGDWLYYYLKRPYSMRRTLTIAMPIFNFPDSDAKFMAQYMSAVLVDRDMEDDWPGTLQPDVERGQKLFEEKGCMACHQVHGKGGDVGPSFTTQVPDFPVATWVGDKLQGGWIFRWLKEPHALVPDALEPNYGLSDQERADLTAFLLSLKNTEYQPKKQQDHESEQQR